MISKPVSLGVFDVDCNEYMSYQYLPIKMAGSMAVAMEDRVSIFHRLITDSIMDFINCNGSHYYRDQYVYLTIKSGYQRGGMGFNRPGWHVDGFGTEDENYIWSNCQPTIFNDGPFDLSDDEHKSMVEMEQQANPANDYCFPDKTLVRMGRSVHRVGPYIEGHRVFFKISFSREKFNLLGNSHNYLINYDWDMQERKKERNVPCSNK